MRVSAQRLRRLIGRVSTISTMSPGLASFFSSWTMNFDVRRSVLPYSPCRTCHSTATTMLFCILLLTTTPTFSDFCAIKRSLWAGWPGQPGGAETASCLSCPSCLSSPLLPEHRLDAREVAAHRAHFVGRFELSHRLLDAH